MRKLSYKNLLILRTCMLLLLLTGFSRQAFATHAAGSDIKYTCLGGLQYQVTVTFYRDCGGVAEPSTIPVNVKSVNGHSNTNITANKVLTSGAEITVPCSGTTSNCNGGASTGIRKFEYTATVTLPSQETDWIFSYSVCCRNCAITTIYTPCSSNSTLYVEARLNNVIAPCNSSPDFSNIPIAFVCIGQNFNYNHGVIDPNGDSLSYELIAPKTTNTSTVSFIPPANINNPIASSTPFTLNPTTGDLNFTPSQVQIGVMAILISEYRNGQFIGSVIRDMQIYTTACSNNLPTATGINGTSNYNLTVCPNQPICFTINTADLDTAQSVTVTTNSGISNASYTISSGPRPTLTFCWTPTNNDIDLNPKTFTVTVRDNACPNNGIQTYSYNLYVPGPKISTSFTNVTCNGLANGTATAIPFYTSNYNYSWNTTPPANTATVNNLPAGNYTVTATDANGCTAQRAVTITQPPAILIGNTKVNPSCAGICNGSINLSISGGAAPYSYLWSNGQSTQDLAGLCSGTYTVTVTDAGNCSKSLTVALPGSYTMSASTTVTNVKCYGNSTGSVLLTVSNGTPPLTYTWSNGSSTQNLASAGAGTYTATVTDINGCTATTNAAITQPSAALNIVTSKTNILCYGNTTGAISTVISGGTTPYTYSWNTGSTASALNNLSAGIYTVTVTDANNCSSQATVNLSQPASALSLSLNKTNVKCFGNTTGNVNSTVSGGTMPYSYQWNNGSTASVLNNIPAGTYTLTVTDANACSIQQSIMVDQPAGSLNVTSTVTHVNCYGGTGSVQLSVTGGTTPYNYNWSNGTSLSQLNNVAAGTYSVTITDANNCTSSVTAVITQPLAPLTATLTPTNIRCNGNSTGSISLSASGGSTPYSYLWNNGSVTQNLSGLAAGSYQVTISDSKGCITNGSTTLSQPSAPLSLSISKTDVNCFGNTTGNINIAVAGGTTPYSYQWNTGSTSSSVTNIAAGNYTVTVTDANNCTATAAITITQPSAILSSTFSIVNVNCFNSSTGSITANPAGGTAPYTYTWNNGVTTQANSNLPAGNYSVIITDSKGCSINKNVTVTQPSSPVTMTASITNADCRGNATGTITVNPSGGTSPYNYLWSNGATIKNLTGLVAGSYTVTITDSKGCGLTATYAVSQPAANLSGNLSYTHVNCFGGSDGSALMNANGGTGPYTYTWSNGATTQAISALSAGSYTVTVSDQNGCTIQLSQAITEPASSLSLSETHVNVTCYSLPMGSIDISVSGGTPSYSYLWSNGASTQDIANISNGNYTVTVTDNQGCTAIQSVTITQPAGELNVSSAVTAVDCYGNSNGAIDLTASSGTPPYHYSWSNGSTSEDLSGLSTGAYTSTIADNNGCSLIITNYIAQPKQPLSADITPTPIPCFGLLTGIADLNIKGGTTPYTYTWNNGATTEDLQNVAAGKYSVSVIDANGCSAAATTAITQPTAALAIGSSVTQPNCNGINNGSIHLSLSGGTTPYSIAWSNGDTSTDIDQLAPGTYAVTVTDNNGCSDTKSFSINYTASALTVSTNIQPVKCKGDLTGIISLDVSGGTAPYSYSLNNAGAAAVNNNLAAGNYAITITDVNGCNLNYNAVVNEPAEVLNVNALTSSITCYGNSSGSVDITVNGGTIPYSYSWSDNNTTEDLNGVGAGDYTVTVTDLNQCIVTGTYSIAQPLETLAINFAVTDAGCNGDSSGSITALVSGGTAPYSLNWNTGSTQAAISNLPASTYTLTAIDANGCSLAAQADVNQPSQPLQAAVTSSLINCFGDSSGSSSVVISGGSPPYHITWSTGDSTNSIMNLPYGSYDYVINDNHECGLRGIVSISQPAFPLSLSATTVAVNCTNDPTGAINISPSGGTAPYSFQWNTGNSSEDISGITAGDYTVTITDANGCVLTQTFTIAQPASALAAQTSITDVQCRGEASGSVQVAVTGGTAPYNYTWSTGDQQNQVSQLTTGTYTVTVTDALGCTLSQSVQVNEPAAVLTVGTSTTNVRCYNSNNGSVNLAVAGGTGPYTYLWSDGSVQPNLVNIGAGTYAVTVSDSHQCNVTMNVNIQQPSPGLTTTLSANGISCNGGNTGNINTIVTGGTSPYTYSWNTGAVSSTLAQVQAGTYTLTVSDANNCISTSTITVTQPAAVLNMNSTVNNIACKGIASGSVDITVTGGTAPYNYTWNNGSSTEDPQNLQAGTYTVVISDLNGCTTSGTVQVTEPSSTLTASANVQEVNCSNSSSGSIHVNVSGGTAPYMYTWNTGSNSQDLNNIPAGNYTVTITDANGCSDVHNTIIQQPSASVSMTAIVRAANCIAGQAGSIAITPSGGTAPYTYNWNTGAATAILNGLTSGTYNVIISDVNGCSASAEYNVDDSTNLDVQAKGSATVCMGNLVTLESNVPSQNNITLQWLYNGTPLNGAVTPAFSTPVAGVYTLIATSACGIDTSNQVEVIVRSLNNVSVSNSVIICPGDRVQLLAGGGLTYNWSPSSNLSDPSVPNPVAFPTQTTTYTVEVKDDFGCTAAASVTVNVMCDTLDIPNGFSPNNDGTNDTFVIDGIAHYPGNVLFIYNRWGNLVYKKHDYDNSWNGTANVNGVMFGEQLPNGTYYYLLDLNVNQKPFNGFVVLRR